MNGNAERAHAMIARAARARAQPASCARRRPHGFPLAEAAEAHRYIESRHAFGRVLLIP